MKKVLLGFCLLMLSQHPFAQEFLKKNEYFFSYHNGLKLFVRENAEAKRNTVALVFNCGAYLEDDNYDGLSVLYEHILIEKIKRNIKGAIPQYASDSSLVSVYSETTHEYVFVRLSFANAPITRVLEAICKSVVAPIDSSDIASAVSFSNIAFQKIANNPLARMDSTLGSYVWTTNFSKRLFHSAWNDSTAALLPQRLAAFQAEYFCPGNALLLIAGNVVSRDVNSLVRKVFEVWKKCVISLLGQFPGINYKLILNNVQLTMEDSLIKNPFYRVALQGVAPFEGLRYKYCEMVLAEIISNPNSKLHRYFKDSCHLRLVHMENELNQHFNQITFTISPDSVHVGEGIHCFRSFLKGDLDTLIDETDVQAAKDAVLAKHKNVLTDNEATLRLVANYWKNVSIDGYDTFEDSVQLINAKDVHQFLKKYFYSRKSVTALAISPSMRASLNIDSIYTPLATEVTAYHFNFLKNSARFASAADDSVFNSLLQFLKLNDELKVKINGKCHESELLEISDEEMLKWVRSLDHFILNPPSLLQAKRFRLDVYRALTMIKKLTDAGIPLNRLFGTGNIIRSKEEDSTPYQVAGCSLMFN